MKLHFIYKYPAIATCTLQKMFASNIIFIMLLLAIEAVHDGRSWEILIILVIINESQNYPSNYLIWAI